MAAIQWIKSIRYRSRASVSVQTSEWSDFDEIVGARWAGLNISDRLAWVFQVGSFNYIRWVFRLDWIDRKASVTRITTHFNCNDQEITSEHTECWTSRWMRYKSRRPHGVPLLLAENLNFLYKKPPTETSTYQSNSLNSVSFAGTRRTVCWCLVTFYTTSHTYCLQQIKLFSGKISRGLSLASSDSTSNLKTSLWCMNSAVIKRCCELYAHKSVQGLWGVKRARRTWKQFSPTSTELWDVQDVDHRYRDGAVWKEWKALFNH